MANFTSSTDDDDLDGDATNPFLTDHQRSSDEMDSLSIPGSLGKGQPGSLSRTGSEQDLSKFSLKNVTSIFNSVRLPNLPTPPDSAKKVKSKVWHSVVNIVVIEARDLTPKLDNTVPDPFAKFKLGAERYKSKVKLKTLNPQWNEQFDLYMFDDQPSLLEISVKGNEIGGREHPMGSCEVALEKLQLEKTHYLQLDLSENNGTIVLLISISNILTDEGMMFAPPLPYSFPEPEPHKSKIDVLKEFNIFKSFGNMKNVGWLQIKVLRAYGLSAVDMGGTSDPYCVIEVDNSRIQTPTLYKTLSPEWNRTFTFQLNDIHSIIEVTVYDENRNKKVDFLGKVAIHLLKVKPGEKQWYQLKDAKLMNKKKGVIQLEIDFVYNQLKAAIRTFNPKERKYTSPEPKFKVATMRKNIDRVTKMVGGIMDSTKIISSCLAWESKPKSIIALIIYIITVLYVELYMLPLLIVIIFLKNLMVMNIVESFKDSSSEEVYEEDEDDDLDPKTGEKKGFMEKFQAIQDVCLQVQEAMDMVACIGERIRNALTWKVPWLSTLALIVLTIATIATFLVPLRVILLAWGINKFSKKLRNPLFVDNNELLDYLSRCPSDKQLIQYKELKPDSLVQVMLRKKHQ